MGKDILHRVGNGGHCGCETVSREVLPQVEIPEKWTLEPPCFAITIWFAIKIAHQSSKYTICYEALAIRHNIKYKNANVTVHIITVRIERVVQWSNLFSDSLLFYILYPTKDSMTFPWLFLVLIFSLTYMCIWHSRLGVIPYAKLIGLTLCNDDIIFGRLSKLYPNCKGHIKTKEISNSRITGPKHTH